MSTVGTHLSMIVFALTVSSFLFSLAAYRASKVKAAGYSLLVCFGLILLSMHQYQRSIEEDLRDISYDLKQVYVDSAIKDLMAKAKPEEQALGYHLEDYAEWTSRVASTGRGEMMSTECNMVDIAQRVCLVCPEAAAARPIIKVLYVESGEDTLASGSLRAEGFLRLLKRLSTNRDADRPELEMLFVIDETCWACEDAVGKWYAETMVGIRKAEWKSTERDDVWDPHMTVPPAGPDSDLVMSWRRDELDFYRRMDGQRKQRVADVHLALAGNGTPALRAAYRQYSDCCWYIRLADLGWTPEPAPGFTVLAVEAGDTFILTFTKCGDGKWVMCLPHADPDEAADCETAFVLEERRRFPSEQMVQQREAWSPHK